MDPQPIAPMSRRGFFVMSGAIAATAAIAPQLERADAAGLDPTIPTWRSFSGYALGSQKASAAEMDSYVEAVAAISPRVITEPVGLSMQGRELRIMVVSHPDNIKNLGSLERTWRALRDRPTTAEAGAQTATTNPAFVVMLPNVHGNEPSGSDAMMQVLYDLAAGTDAKTMQRLRDLVIVMMVSQNPDGRVGNHRTSARGFDLNRDWFALTQEETPTKIALYRRFPALLGMDLHEQFLEGNDSFYFPPNADPVHAEASRSGVASSNNFISPTIAKAFDAKGYTYTHYGIYDLFAPIYGDSVPNLAFGASGFIVEMENENQYPDKFARCYTAADAAIDAVLTHRTTLASAWAKQWVENVARGSAGVLAQNFVQNPGAAPALKVPNERIYGYAIRITRRLGDVALLVDRLLQYGVQVHQVTRKVSVSKLRDFGGSGFTESELAVGTIVVTAAQPMKHWVHIILADDPHASVNYFYDVSGWSNPLMMALEGGAIGSDIAPLFSPTGSRLKAVTASSQLAGPAPSTTAPAYSFAIDTSVAQAAVFALIADGVAVHRAPSGEAVVTGKDGVAALGHTQPRGIPLVALSKTPQGIAELRRPKVALVHDIISDTAEILFARSSGFAQWLLQTKLGLDVTLIYANEIDAGTLTLGGYDALVMPAGFETVLPGGLPNVDLSLPVGGMTPAGLLEINLFVRQGGSFLGWSRQGITTAQAAGIAGNLSATTALSGLTVPGSPFAVEIHDGDPATIGLAGFATCFNVHDPILHGGGTTIVSYPAQPRSFGFSEGAGALAHSVGATSMQIGRGRSYVFSFDPAFRAWTESTQAIVGNALLAPPSPGGTTLPLPINAELLKQSFLGRQVVVRVASSDAHVLQGAVARLTGAPDTVALADSELGYELLASVADPLGAHVDGWVRRLLADLDDQGVRPTMVIA